MKYRSEIDGLRSIAVLAVILYHAGFSFASGGFVGVDVFFVISGLLITSIILEDLKEGRFSIKRFYERRARRILPALFVVSTLCLVPAWLWMFPGEFVAFGRSLVGVATFSTNIVFWLQTNYFSPDSGRMPLLHTWSLGVEEQYYLLVPLTLSWLWVWLRGNRTALLIPIGVIGVVSLGLAEWGSRTDPSATFYLLHTRVWELMIGSAVAISSRQETPATPVGWRTNVFSVAGLLMILYSIVAFNDQTTRFPSLLALIPTVGTMLVLRFGDRATAIGRFLGWKPLVGIGLISYSLYLWHQPLFAFARIQGGQELTTSQASMLIAVAVLLASVTWRLVETPFRRPGVVSGRVIWAGSLAWMTALVLTGVVFEDKRVAQRHFTMKQQEMLAWLAYPEQSKLYRQLTCNLGGHQKGSEFADDCISSGPSEASAVVVWGDSYAAAMYMGIAEFSMDRIRGQLTASACPPLIGFTFKPHPGCPGINEYALKKIQALAHPNVLLGANWTVYAGLPGFLESLANTIKTLKEMGANPIVLGQTPVWYPSLPEALARHYEKAGDLPRVLFTNQTQPFTAQDDRMEKTAKEAGAPFVRILPLLCVREGCQALVITNGKATPLVWDSGHFTREGSHVMGRLIAPAVRALLRP